MENAFYKGSLTIKATTEQQISIALTTENLNGENIIEQLMIQTPWVLYKTNHNKTIFHYTLNNDQIPYHEKILNTLTQHGVEINGEYYNDNIEYQNIKIMRNNNYTQHYEEKNVEEYPQTYYMKIEQQYTLYQILKHIIETNQNYDINVKKFNKINSILIDNPNILTKPKQIIGLMHEHGFTYADYEEIEKIVHPYNQLVNAKTPAAMNSIPEIEQPLKGTITITTNPQTNSKLKNHTKKPHTQNIIETLLNRNNITMKHSVMTGLNKNITMSYAVFQNYIWTEQLDKTLTAIVKQNGWVEGRIKDKHNNTWMFTKITGKPEWYTEKTIPAIVEDTYIKKDKNSILEYLTIKMKYYSEETVKTETLRTIFQLIETQTKQWNDYTHCQRITAMINNILNMKQKKI